MLTEDFVEFVYFEKTDNISQTNKNRVELYNRKGIKKMFIKALKYKEKKVVLYSYIWILTGMIISFALCSMILSGSLSTHKFYNVGEVYEVTENIFRTPAIQDGGYLERNGKVVLDEGYFEYVIPIENNKNLWNYLCVTSDTSDAIHWKVNYDQIDDERIAVTEEYNIILRSGMNLIDVPKNNFNCIRITATGNKGDSFSISSMQLRENKPVWSVRKACLIFGAALLIYIIFSIFFLCVWSKMGIKINIHYLIDIIQNIYIIFVKQLQKIISYSPKHTRYTRYGRVFIFVMMFLYSLWVETQDTYYINFSYNILIYSVLIIAIVVLSIDSLPVKKQWNNFLVSSWVVLWTMACVSDFLIPKNFRFLSCTMIFVIGFFIFIWNNMKNPEELIQDFTYAIHIFFIFICAFCLLSRPAIDGIRYSGISRNPSVFGLYVATIWAVILGEIEAKIKGGYCLRRLLPYIVELCLVFSFCWKAQSACPFLCIIGMGCICFLRIVCFASKKIKRNLVLVILCGLILLFPVYKGLSLGLKYIPQFTGISITYVGEYPVAKQEYGMVVYAKDLKETIRDSRIGQKFTDTTISGIFSGRDYYYRAYLRDMNLFGHEKNPELWGIPRLPHNAILGMAHRYGVFTTIPYILMLAAVIIRTFKYSLKKGEYTSVPFYVCLSAIIMSMIDNVELPFLWLPWFGLYLMMGIAFDDDIVYGTEKKDNEEKNTILSLK